MVDVFWHCVNATRDICGEEFIDTLTIPDYWDSWLSNTTPTPWRTSSERAEAAAFNPFDALTPFDPARCRRNMTTLIRAELNYDSGTFSVQYNYNLTNLRRMVRDTFQDMQRTAPQGGIVLLSGGSAPTGIDNLIRLHRRHSHPLRELGDTDQALPSIGESLHHLFHLASTVNIYVIGSKSLHQCFPRRGYQWLQRSTDDAMAYLPTVIQTHMDVWVDRYVNCRGLVSDHVGHPDIHGHLGSHPKNCALFLDHRANLPWRQRRYVEIWILLQSTRIQDGPINGGNMHNVYACKQAKHRSVQWSMLESKIWEKLGFDIVYHPMSTFAQNKSTCQIENRPHGCEYCGCANDDFDWLHEHSHQFFDAATDEFFEVVLALERLYQ